MPSHSRLNLLLASTLVGGMALCAALAPEARDIRNRWFEDRYLRQCRSNLKNLGTACEMYTTDNGGRYPKTLCRVAPRYLKALPNCPTTDTDSYSVTFQSASNPDVYTIVCRGRHPRRLPPPEFGTYRSVGTTQ